MNNIEENPAQHEERRSERREVHVQQMLPGDLVHPHLCMSRTAAGQVTRQLWQVITVQHGIWEICKLQVEERIR